MREVEKKLGETASDSNHHTCSNTNPHSPFLSPRSGHAKREPSEGKQDEITPPQPSELTMGSSEVADRSLTITSFDQLLQPMTMASLRCQNRQRRHVLSGTHIALDHKLPEQICKSYLESLNPSLVRKLRTSGDLDEILLTLQFPFIKSVKNAKWDQDLKDFGWKGNFIDLTLISLELLIVGIATVRHYGPSHFHCIAGLNTLALEHVSDAASSIAMKDVAREARQSVEKLREELNLPFLENMPATFAKHHDVNSTTSEKARAFVNMAKHYKEFGIFSIRRELDDKGQLTGDAVHLHFNPFMLCKGMEIMAEALFRQDPTLTVGDVEATFIACAYVDHFRMMAPKEGRFDDLWHARRGADVRFFLKHYGKIRRQLESQDIYHWIRKMNAEE